MATARESIDRGVSGAELRARVHAMVDDFRAAAEQTDRERRIPKESVARMVDVGLARALVPERFGGLEFGLDVWFDVTRGLAKAETSHGWCAELMMHNPHYATYFPFAGQHGMWAGGPDVTVAGSLAPVCRVESSDGGYVVSGRSPFASGVSHAMWSFVGGMIPDGSGGVEWAWFLIPAEEYEVEDTWHTIAMRGTGSNTIVTDAVFVPEDRVLRAEYVIEGDVPGERPSENAMYRRPIAGFGPLGFSVTALATCEGAFEEFQRWMAERRAPDGSLMADRPRFHFAAARIASNIDAAELLLRRLWRLRWRRRRPIQISVRVHCATMRRLLSSVSRPLTSSWRSRERRRSSRATRSAAPGGHPLHGGQPRDQPGRELRALGAGRARYRT